MFHALHKKALRVASEYKRAESELISVLQEIDACKGFSELGYPSLFSYVNRALGLSEACAYQLIAVGRKSREVPALRMSIAKGETTISKAKAIVSVITPGNQQEWLEKARILSTRELERAVAEAKPDLPKRTVLKTQRNGFARLNASLDAETLMALRRSQELLAQRKGRSFSMPEAIKELAVQYVKRNDPIAKADRNIQNTLHVKSKVHHRDRGACQYQMPDGSKCGEKKWIHLHHIQPRSSGGQDTKENLTTLCAAHHRLIHAH